MKKFIFALCMLMVATMLLSACTPAATPTTTPPTTAPAAPAQPTQAPVQPTAASTQAPAPTSAPTAAGPAPTIAFVPPTPNPKEFAGKEVNFLTIQPHQVAAENLAKWFQEDTGAKVNLQVVGYDVVTEKAVLDVTSGADAVDVVEYWYPGLGALVDNNVLVNIDDWWNQNKDRLQFSDYYPDYMQTFTMINGHHYGVPYDGDLHLLYYNKILFSKYNLQPPTTWDEYLNDCKTITEGEKGNNVYGCAIMGQKTPLILIGTYLSRLGSYGGSFFDSQGNPTINSPEAVAALQALVDESKYALPTLPATDFNAAISAWTSGKAAMMEFWTDLGSMTDAPNASSIAHQWGVVPMPKGTGPKAQSIAPVNAGFAIGVSTGAKNKDVAMAFLEYVARPDIALRYNTVVGGIDPIRRSTLENPTYRAFVGEDMAKAIEAAHLHNVFWPTSAIWSKLQEPLNDNLALAIVGSKTPQQALDDTQKAWQDLLKK